MLWSQFDQSWFWEWWTLFCNSYQLYPFLLFFGTNAANNFFIISPLHGHGISQDVNIHFSMVLMSRTSFKSWKPPKFGLFLPPSHAPHSNVWSTTFGTICNNASANFTLPFQPNLCPLFVLSSQIKWTRGCRWLRNLVNFKF